MLSHNVHSKVPLSYTKLYNLERFLHDKKENMLKILTVPPEELTTSPRFNLKIEDMDVVLFSGQLIENIVLQVSYSDLMGFQRTKTFDETLAYDEIERNKFRKLVIKRDAYLEVDSNYFEISKEFLSKGTQSTMLTNSRVVVFWRGLTLTDFQVKRLLTLGLLYLVQGLTKAELIFHIRETIPKGKYEVFIQERKNSFVIIGVEEPIF